MPLPPLSILRATFALTLFATAAASAQTPGPCGIGPAGETMVQGLQGASKSSSPLSVTISITHEQKFADGNAIRGAVTTHQYRDSTGRTRSEMPMGCSMSADTTKPATRFQVLDPVAHTVLVWGVNNGDVVANTALLSHMTVNPSWAGQSASTEQRQQMQQYQQRMQSRIVRENLGSRSIAGVMCDDVRTTRTTPAGEQGNDLPMRQVMETCTARELNLVLLYATESPQSGRTVLEVTDVVMGEPDTSLFKAPAGYTVQDQKTVTQPVEQK